MKYFTFLTLFLFIYNLIDENILISKFDDFKQTYNKTYYNFEEEQNRYNTFKRNFEKYGYVNAFSDVPDREQALEELKNPKTIPSKLSYIDYFGQAKDQKSCGFCFVFSFLGHLEGQYKFKYDKSYRFSEQYLLDCSNDKLNCSGGDFNIINDFLFKKSYLALEDYGEYTGKKNQKNCDFLDNKNNLYNKVKRVKINTIKSHKKVSNDKNQRMKNAKKCIQSLLVKHGPLSAAVIHGYFDGYQKNDIVESESCPSISKTDHNIIIVGYDTYYSQITKKTETYWIIRDSYGKDLGNNGYTKVKAGDNICQIESNIMEINIGWNSWCGEGCDECNYISSQDKLECKSCITGYRYFLSSCEKCKVQHCATCTNSVSSCEKCEEGYFSYTNPSSTCFKCHPNCKTCYGPGENDCYITAEEIETYIDNQINENCICYGKYLSAYISLIILFLLI